MRRESTQVDRGAQVVNLTQAAERVNGGNGRRGPRPKICVCRPVLPGANGAAELHEGDPCPICGRGRLEHFLAPGDCDMGMYCDTCERCLGLAWDTDHPWRQPRDPKAGSGPAAVPPWLVSEPNSAAVAQLALCAGR